MKKQHINLSKFKTLETSNNILKGGFSEVIAAKGGSYSRQIELNLASNCGINTNCINCGINNTAGCGTLDTA